MKNMMLWFKEDFEGDCYYIIRQTLEKKFVCDPEVIIYMKVINHITIIIDRISATITSN